MELRSIETFLAIVEYGTFSRAAERLGYAQSAVTVQMRQLEQELGVRLFDRIPRGVRLTEQGRTFALHANEVAEAVSRARTAVELGDAPSQDVRGTIRLGSVESVSTALLPELLIAFHERCPHVQVVVTTDRREDMMAGLASNTIDMLLTMERHICLNGVVCEALREEHVVFLASPALLCARGVEDGEPVGVDALGRLPFVLTERGESYRLELDRLLAERDVTIEPLVEAGNTETLVHLAERGVGGDVRAAVLGCQRARIGDARGAWERHAGGAHGDPDALARAQVDRPAPGGVHPGDAAVLRIVGANDAPGQMAPGGGWCPGVSGASERVHRSGGRPTRRRAATSPVLASAPIFHVRAVPPTTFLTVRVQNSSAHMATVHTGGKVLHALKR